jgi:hypothetical protein
MKTTKKVWQTIGRETEGFVIKGEFDNPEEALDLANKLNVEQDLFYYDYRETEIEVK